MNNVSQDNASVNYKTPANAGAGGKGSAVFNLAEYLHERYPGCIVGGLRAERKRYRIKCLWRGEHNASGTLSYTDDEWLWYDHGTGRGGNSFQFLTEIEGMTKQQAAKLMFGNMPIPPKTINHDLLKPKEPIMEKTRNKLSDKSLEMLEQAQLTLEQKGLPPTWSKRGLNLDDAIAYGLGRVDNDTLIPIIGEDGEVVHIKRRYDIPKGDDRPRYLYVESGLGSPPWISPVILAPELQYVILVEGEGKAMSLHNALHYYAKERDTINFFGTIGIAGANGSVPVEFLKKLGKKVYIIPDIGEAGSRAVHGTPDRKGWEQTLIEAGIETRVLPPFADLCDLAYAYTVKFGHAEGNAKFAEEVLGLINSADQGHSVRLKANKIMQNGTLSPEIIREFGRSYKNDVLLYQHMIRLLAQGNFIIPSAIDPNANIDESMKDVPIIRQSYTKLAQAMGKADRRQAPRNLEHLTQLGYICPMPKGFYPKVITTYALEDINCYAIIKICGDDIDGNGFFAVRDVTRKNKEVHTPIGVLGQLAIQHLRRKGAMSFAELKKYLGKHGNTVRNMVERLVKLGLVTVVDGVISLTKSWFKVWEAYFGHMETFMEKRIRDLWAKVFWANKPTCWWFREGTVWS